MLQSGFPFDIHICNLERKFGFWAITPKTQNITFFCLWFLEARCKTCKRRASRFPDVLFLESDLCYSCCYFGRDKLRKLQKKVPGGIRDSILKTIRSFLVIPQEICFAESHDNTIQGYFTLFCCNQQKMKVSTGVQNLFQNKETSAKTSKFLLTCSLEDRNSF